MANGGRRGQLPDDLIGDQGLPSRVVGNERLEMLLEPNPTPYSCQLPFTIWIHLSPRPDLAGALRHLGREPGEGDALPVRLRFGAGPTDTDVGVPGPSTATARRGPGPPTAPLGSRYRDHARHGTRRW
jgi:hypothetical protein